MRGLIVFLIKDSFLFELFKKGVSQHKIKNVDLIEFYKEIIKKILKIYILVICYI